MAAYIVRRLLWMVVLLFVVTLITFVIFNVLPSADPAVLRAGRQPSPELIAAIRAAARARQARARPVLRLHRDILPFVFTSTSATRYQNEHRRSCAQILDRLPATIFLDRRRRDPVALRSASRSASSRAVKRGSLLDRLAMGLALIAISAPVYLLGLVALYLFSEDIGKLPALPGQRRLPDAEGFFGKAEALIMPWCVLAAAFAAIYARFLRGNLIDTMQEDYIRTARAKGLSRAARGLPPRRALGDHADRDAARPRHRHPARRRDPHRDRLQHPGHRAATRSTRSARDLPVDPGHRAVRRVLHRHA